MRAHSESFAGLGMKEEILLGFHTPQGSKFNWKQWKHHPINYKQVLPFMDSKWSKNFSVLLYPTSGIHIVKILKWWCYFCCWKFHRGHVLLRVHWKIWLTFLSWNFQSQRNENAKLGLHPLQSTPATPSFLFSTPLFYVPWHWGVLYIFIVTWCSKRAWNTCSSAKTQSLEV